MPTSPQAHVAVLTCSGRHSLPTMLTMTLATGTSWIDPDEHAVLSSCNPQQALEERAPLNKGLWLETSCCRVQEHLQHQSIDQNHYDWDYTRAHKHEAQLKAAVPRARKHTNSS